MALQCALTTRAPGATDEEPSGLPAHETFRFAGPEPEGVLRVLYRERRAHFVSHGHCKRCVAKGRVLVDGEAARAGTLVAPGALVAFRPTHEVRSFDDGVRKVVYFEKLRVLFEDDAFAVVVKPPGLAMHDPCVSGHKRSDASKARPSTRTLAAMLPYCLRPSCADDALAVPAAVHRLDAPVGGVVAVAKTRGAARRLQAAFDGRAARKIYVALLAGTPQPSEGEVRLPIDGKLSCSTYEVLASQRSARFGSISTVRLRLHSGRTHQLRRHAAEGLHCPIIGDTTYGGQASSQALYLWAASLELPPLEALDEAPPQALDGAPPDGPPLEPPGGGAEGGPEGGSEEPPGDEQPGGGACGARGGGASLMCFDAPPPPKFDKLLQMDKRAWEHAARGGTLRPTMTNLLAGQVVQSAAASASGEAVPLSLAVEPDGIDY